MLSSVDWSWKKVVGLGALAFLGAKYCIFFVKPDEAAIVYDRRVGVSGAVRRQVNICWEYLGGKGERKKGRGNKKREKKKKEKVKKRVCLFSSFQSILFPPSSLLQFPPFFFFFFFFFF